jgi:hypothetical protein
MLHHPLETFYVLWNVASLIEQIVIMFSDNVGYENSWNNAKIKQHNQVQLSCVWTTIGLTSFPLLHIM